jgi:hypothetical protein
MFHASLAVSPLLFVEAASNCRRAGSAFAAVAAAFWAGALGFAVAVEFAFGIAP